MLKGVKRLKFIINFTKNFFNNFNNYYYETYMIFLKTQTRMKIFYCIGIV